MKENTWYTDYNIVHYRDSNDRNIKIRHNHPDLKGSFTCLGVWYNILSDESMKVCNEMLKDSTPGDRKTGLKQIQRAKEALQNWQPKDYMIWFYEEYQNQSK